MMLTINTQAVVTGVTAIKTSIELDQASQLRSHMAGYKAVIHVRSRVHFCKCIEVGGCELHTQSSPTAYLR